MNIYRIIKNGESYIVKEGDNEIVKTDDRRLAI